MLYRQIYYTEYTLTIDHNLKFQVFPGNLLEPNYADPDDPDKLVARSEVERRKEYFDLLPFGARHSYLQLTKDCLHNSPLRRPTAEQLVATLEGMTADIEGPYGAVARADAVRQVVMMKTFVKKDTEMREKVNELEAKNKEIQTLQQQVVCLQKLNSV